MTQDTTNKPHFYFKAKLECGAVVEFLQPEPYMNLTISLTPPDGIPIKDTAEIKDNKLIVRSTIKSLAGFYQLMQLMAGDQLPKRKKIFGIF